MIHPLISHLRLSSSEQRDGEPFLGRGQGQDHLHGRGHDTGLGDIVPAPYRGHRIAEKIPGDGRMTRDTIATVTIDGLRGGAIVVKKVKVEKESSAKKVLVQIHPYHHRPPLVLRDLVLQRDPWVRIIATMIQLQRSNLNPPPYQYQNQTMHRVLSSDGHQGTVVYSNQYRPI